MPFSRLLRIGHSCLILVCFLAFGFAGKSVQAQLAVIGVHLDPLPVETGFANAAARTALNFACAGDIVTLEKAFRSFSLNFDGGLLRTHGNEVCHVWYAPSLPGFRADPDDWPVSELFFDVNTLSYFSRRQSLIGDSLDIAKQVLLQVQRPLRVTVGVGGQQGKDWRSEATLFHFPASIHQVRLRDDAGVDSANPWVQDYMKAGHVDGKRKILVTRNLYEGNEAAGDRFQPLLDSFNSSETVRSNLSWEGGDLLFVRHPWNPDKLVLCYGNAAKAYWGQGLTELEYAYVLRTEFGADYLVDMSEIDSHVDYSLTFLPSRKIALVSSPVRSNFEIAKSAWEYIRQNYAHVQAPEFGELDGIFREGRPTFIRRSGEIDLLLRRIVSRNLPWNARENRELASLTSTFIRKYCPETLEDCLRVDRENRVLRRNAGLLDEWVTASLIDWTDRKLPDRLLAVIESQLPMNSSPKPARLEAKVGELQRLGFKVIRVPKLAGNGELGVPWTGISYVNALFVDPILFVPTFGLGEPEARMLDDLSRKLPSEIRLVPVYAQHMLAYNGGIHCVTGIVRSPADQSPQAPGLAERLRSVAE